MKKCPYAGYSLKGAMRKCRKLRDKSDIDNSDLRDSSGEVTCEVNLICEECVKC